jgi:hypothetical protein
VRKKQLLISTAACCILGVMAWQRVQTHAYLWAALWGALTVLHGAVIVSTFRQGPITEN